jgi:hypothetical protein
VGQKVIVGGCVWCVGLGIENEVGVGVVWGPIAMGWGGCVGVLAVSSQ